MRYELRNLLDRPWNPKVGGVQVPLAPRGKPGSSVPIDNTPEALQAAQAACERYRGQCQIVRVAAAKE